MLKLAEKDLSFVLLAHQAPEILHFMFLKNGEGGHFGNHALAELADIFKKGIGAHFPLKCFR